MFEALLKKVSLSKAVKLTSFCVNCYNNSLAIGGENGFLQVISQSQDKVKFNKNSTLVKNLAAL